MTALPSERAIARDLRAGSTDAIVAALEPIARSVVSGLYLAGGEREDLLQEARIGITKAIRDFRGERGDFIPFARLCAARQVQTAVRAATRVKHLALNEALCIDGDGDDGRALAEVLTLGGQEPHERLLARESVQRMLWTAAHELSDLQRSALVGVDVAGRSYRDVARDLGRTPKAIDNALQRARSRVRSAAEQDWSLTRSRSRVVILVARRDRYTRGWETAVEAAIAALARIDGDADIVSIQRCAVGPDGCERRDTRGRPRADGQRPTAVWKVTLDMHDVVRVGVAS